ncbi:uncharacterized protein MONOS_17743 [Monocercomonoides exilis]|uniref:uncharacterized protein n=1 Tax=Monocercomonoides exilis TaxID=2049356 RepID=UPI0035596305|nr:hypothetical protein MONOS_17743 [Monocercomonoides exilis]
MIWNEKIDSSSLRERIMKMIIDEENKKEEKNEKLLIDLCECFLCLSNYFDYFYEGPSELISICVTNLLIAASHKNEDEETRAEVEIAIVILSKIERHYNRDSELLLCKITEIMKYHQEHRNLSHLAYQAAWRILTRRSFFDPKIQIIIDDDLHFVSETIRELVDLTRYVNWFEKKKEENLSKNIWIIERWGFSLCNTYAHCKFNRNEFVELFSCIANMCKLSKMNYRDLRSQYIYILYIIFERREANVEDLLKGGAVEVCLDEICWPTLENDPTWSCLSIFMFISKELSGMSYLNSEETNNSKRKIIKRRMFEKMEEEGFEDLMISFQEILSFPSPLRISRNFINSSDYFVWK